MKDRLMQIGRLLTDCLYPPACAVCGKPLGSDTGPPGLSGVHLKCSLSVRKVAGDVCRVCGKSIGEEEVLCRDCRDTPHIFKQSVAAYEINAELKDSLYRFKYRNKKEYAVFYAKSIFNAHKDLLRFLQPELIIPVPMYYKKERQRGYNQAALIAETLGELLEMPVDAYALMRIKKTVPLKDCSAKERRMILSGAFELMKPLSVKSILVVDDIYTTGATLDACADVLKRAGAEMVYGAHVCIGAGV